MKQARAPLAKGSMSCVRFLAMVSRQGNPTDDTARKAQKMGDGVTSSVNAPANQTAGHREAPSAADPAAQSEFGKALGQERSSGQKAPATSSPTAIGQGLRDQNTPGAIVRNLTAGAHAIVEGAIWNPTVWGSVSRNAQIARDTSRGVWVERFLGNTGSAAINRLTGSLGRYTAAADRATSTVVQQIKSTSNFRKVAQITRDATRDAARFIAGDATYAGRAAQARIVVPTGTPRTAIDAAENALSGLRKAIPGTVAAPKVTSGLPGVGGIALKVLAPLGAGLSAQALGEDIAKGDVAAAVTDGAGMVAGGLETFAIASTALGASGTTATSATAVGVGLGGTATGAAAFAAQAAPVVAAAGVGVAVGTYINNNTKISDTAVSAGTWVEQHTGGSVIAGATAAAATSIVTTPYYAGVAAVDVGGKALDYAKDNMTLNPSEIDLDRTLKPWKWF
jgi:hypothetical protein